MEKKAATDRLEVESAQKLWISAAETSDVNQYASLMMDTFFCITIEGTHLQREEFLNGIRAQKRKIAKLNVLEFQTDVYGDSAVVNCLVAFDAHVESIPYKGPYRITATWVRSNGFWKVACYHASDVSKREAWDKLLNR